jgi:hypothetical protein
MRSIRSILIVAILAVASMAAVASAAPTAPADPTAQAGTRQFEGTVVSVNRANRSFRLRDEGRITRIRVTSRTRYERLNGFSSIRRGMTGVEAIVRRSNGQWVAISVERSGGASDDRGRGRGNDD